jgi:hypothetical protein
MSVDLGKRVEVAVYDRDTLAQLTRIFSYTYFRYQRNYRTHDTFEFRLHPDTSGAEHISTDALVAYYDGSAVRAGMVEYIERTFKNGNEELVCRGRCIGGLFRDRIALVGTDAGTGYDVQSATPAETAMIHYVDGNCISGAAARAIPNLVTLIDGGAGGNINYSARFETIHDILEILSLSSGLGWDVVFNRTAGDFEFTVREGSDLSSDVIFSPKFNNIKDLEYIESLMGYSSVAAVAGDGEADLRTVRYVWTDAAEPTGYDRREVFVDARDISGNDELDMRGEAKLNESGSGISVNVEVLDQTFRYLDDYDLGDIITVIYPNVFTLSARIVSVIDEVGSDGRNLTLVVGTDAPDVTRLIRESVAPTRGARR